MSADSHARPHHGEPPATTDWLMPRPWRLQDEPPAADARNRAEQNHDAPLLLRVDCRAPLPVACGRSLAASLSREERQRHDTYRLPADRQRFLLGRAGLRRLLGAWLDMAPAAVPLASGPHGKPLCPIGPHVNVSHSGDLILLAAHPLQPVGVDVERQRPQLDWAAIARRMFSASELQELDRSPTSQQPEAFLRIWCRLEARLKARGTGLAGLERLRAQERQATGAGPNDTPESGERLWDVHVPAGYRAAVALAGEP